jgi:hypothetical protein
MGCFHPLARHRRAYGNPTDEAGHYHAERRGVQMERGHGVANATSSIFGADPGPIHGPIRSIDNLSSNISYAADYTDTNAFVAPTSGATDHSINFRANHPDLN